MALCCSVFMTTNAFSSIKDEMEASRLPANCVLGIPYLGSQTPQLMYTASGNLVQLIAINSGQQSRFASNASFEHDGNFNYSNARITDFSTSGNVTLLQDVLAEIRTETSQYNQSKPLQILLRDNYIADAGFSEICNFILGNDYIKENLASIDLGNNRITEKSVEQLLNLLQKTTKLKVDLSINYLTLKKLSSTLPSDALSRVTCHSY